MSKNQEKHSPTNTIAKEVFIGLLAIVLGGYNLLTSMEIIDFFVDIPQIIGNGLLFLAGFFLIITAIKLSRHRYHSKRLF